MSCSECRNWDSCERIDYETKRLIRPCFSGSTVRLDVSEVDKYMRENKQRVIGCNEPVIMIAAVKTSDGRMFNIKSLKIKRQDGAKYICNVVHLQTYYSASRSVFSLYINGVDFSLTRDRFKRLFNLDISDKVRNFKANPYFTPKDSKIEQQDEKKIDEERRLAKERRRQRKLSGVVVSVEDMMLKAVTE